MRQIYPWQCQRDRRKNRGYVADDGAIYTGCNVENAAYGSSICAEANAISSAAANGVRRIESVVIACLDGGERAVEVEAQMAGAQKLGVRGTPAFFVNGVVLTGAMPVKDFIDLIDAELARPR